MRYSLVTAALLGLAACRGAAPDPCAFEAVSIPVTFLGDAYARGTVSLVRDGEGRAIGRARLVRVEGQAPTDGVALDVSGPALCADGIIKVELAGGRTEDGRLEVLGGELNLVLPRAGLVERPFGTWQAELHQDGWAEARKMGGPFVVSVSTASTAVSVR